MRKPGFINGCAKSVVLAKAFEDAGWDPWTCDILPSEGWHKTDRERAELKKDKGEA